MTIFWQPYQRGKNYDKIRHTICGGGDILTDFYTGSWKCEKCAGVWGVGRISYYNDDDLASRFDGGMVPKECDETLVWIDDGKQKYTKCVSGLEGNFGILSTGEKWYKFK